MRRWAFLIGILLLLIPSRWIGSEDPWSLAGRLQFFFNGSVVVGLINLAICCRPKFRSVNRVSHNRKLVKRLIIGCAVSMFVPAVLSAGMVGVGEWPTALSFILFWSVVCLSLIDRAYLAFVDA